MIMKAENLSVNVEVVCCITASRYDKARAWLSVATPSAVRATQTKAKSHLNVERVAHDSMYRRTGSVFTTTTE